MSSMRWQAGEESDADAEDRDAVGPPFRLPGDVSLEIARSRAQQRSDQLW